MEQTVSSIGPPSILGTVLVSGPDTIPDVEQTVSDSRPCRHYAREWTRYYTRHLTKLDQELYQTVDQVLYQTADQTVDHVLYQAVCRQ